MYDPDQVLHAIDRHWLGILALCGMAMVCNYAWFFAAVARGLRDRRYPMPIVSVLFWLVGDASVVVRWLAGRNAYDHWYLRLFSLSLTVTVVCELVFLVMILRFGGKDWPVAGATRRFTALVIAGLVVMAVSWTYLADAMRDPLNITYFFLANMIGPPASAALALQRGDRSGTSPWIWLGYAAMLGFFYTACFAFYGSPYNGWPMVIFYAVNVAAALGTALLIFHLPAAAGRDSDPARPRGDSG